MAAGMKRAMAIVTAAAWTGASLAACSDSASTPTTPTTPTPTTPTTPQLPKDTTPTNPSVPGQTTPTQNDPAQTTPGTTTPGTTTPTNPATPTTPATAPDPMATPANPKLETTKIKIEGTEYELELAVTDETRFHGLSGRTDIPEKGGMIFVFPRPITTGFVMRDCPVPIDIIFLNAGGRITAMHAMQPEAPRSETEKTNVPPAMGAPSWTWTNPLYESRLKKYPSRASAQFAIELKGGTLAKMALKPGQLIEFDREALVKKVK